MIDKHGNIHTDGVTTGTKWQHDSTGNISQLMSYDSYTEVCVMQSLKTGDTFKLTKYTLLRDYSRVNLKDYK